MPWQEQLQTLGRMHADVALAARTTLAVGGAAAWLFRPSHQDCLIQAMSLIPTAVPIFPLGRGSNLLISDQGIDGLVVDLSELSQMQVSGCVVVVGAGVRMSKLAQLAATQGLSGLEFMATVPGDLGGGVAMNAGAFGQQVSDVLQSITVLQRDGVVEVLQREALKMEYRHTLLPQGALVLSATFVLRTADVTSVRQQMREMRKLRSDTQPLARPNCGSVFKNPKGDFAARLIEDAGLKGKRVGKARISDVHANFIVNEGGATCDDVLALMRMAMAQVKQCSGIVLEPEVRLVGCAL